MPPPQTYPSSRRLCSCRTRVVVQRGSGGLDLFERHFLRNHVLDSVADDTYHLAVIRDVGLICQPPVPGDDERATLRFLAGVR